MYADAPYADRPYADIGTMVGFCDVNCDVSATFKYVIYAATRNFVTNADDSISPSRLYLGRLDTPLRYKLSIVGGSDIGTFTGQQDGDCILDNPDGYYDSLPATFTANGRPIEVHAMRDGDDLSQRFLVFKGVMSSWFISETQVGIKVSDLSFKLRVPAQPNLYGGTGGADGGVDLAGKRKPLIFGYVNNWPATLLNSLLIYQVHDGAVNAITAVYDRGNALNFVRDYANYAALAAADLSADDGYVTCIALGLFRLTDDPIGTITADVQGDKTGGTFVSTTAAIIQRWVLRVTELTAADLYAVSFSACIVDQPAPVGYGVSTEDNHTIADVIADLMHGIGGWGGFRREGLLEVRRVVAPTTSPLASISRKDVLSISRDPPPSSYMPPPWRIRIAYERNWTVQTDLASSVTSDRKAYVGSQYRISEASADTIRADYPDAQDPDVRECYFALKADADAEALRLLNFARVERALYRVTLPRKALTYNLGDTNSLAYANDAGQARWDLGLGRNMVVVEVSPNILRPRKGQIDTVEVVLYG